ncbi:hypothetical protein AX15_006811 [Amanita polypyramis BW_CC]|nr:hypothetical protein AX15_006811 [Amanita polypyramis BW_CC]
MDDPDDYFVDDITLDDNTLALLVQEEQKYLNSQNNALLDAPSVSKKRKTDSGWRPGPGSHTDNADDDEYLPEISVQGDGTYEVRDVVRTSIVKNPLNTINTDKSLSSTTRVTEVTTQSGPTFSAGLLNIEQQHSADSTKTENMSTMPFQRASPNSKQHGHAEQQLRELQKRLQEVGVGNILVEISDKA